MGLDSLDKKILKKVQHDFPVCREPYEKLAEQLGVEKQLLIEKLNSYQENGYIRNISPKIRSSKVGYSASTLVAVKADERVLEDVAEVINRYKGVTHNYRRTADYNVWFTLHAEDEERLEEILGEIREDAPLEDLISLPRTKKFKLHVDLDLGGVDGD